MVIVIVALLFKIRHLNGILHQAKSKASSSIILSPCETQSEPRQTQDPTLNLTENPAYGKVSSQAVSSQRSSAPSSQETITAEYDTAYAKMQAKSKASSSIILSPCETQSEPRQTQDPPLDLTENPAYGKVSSQAVSSQKSSAPSSQETITAEYETVYAKICD